MKFLQATLLSLLLIVFSSGTLPLASAQEAVDPQPQVKSLVIYQLQTGGAATGTASQEIVLLYNNANEPRDVTNWCMKYSSSTDLSGFQKCLTPPNAQTQLWIPAQGVISFATNEYVLANTGFVPDVVFSAGISATGGHIRLLEASGIEVDKVAWGTGVNPEGSVAAAHLAGKVLSRQITNLEVVDTNQNAADFTSSTVLSIITSSLYEEIVPVDVCPNIEGLQVVLPDGFLLDDDLNCQQDVCPNLDELQIAVPTGYEYVDGACLLIPVETRMIYVTELYPNAPSYDTGQEFIELYNPHSSEVNIKGYTLRAGPDFQNDYVFGEFIIAPLSYVSLSDSQSGIVLPNTSGVSIQLVNAAGVVVYETPIYDEMKEASSWVLLEDQWIVTNQLTPAAPNKPYVAPADDEVLGVTTVLAPCAAGKYRNPDTNRCRTIESAVSTLVACDEDEYRNPDTNRCRKITTASTGLKPCDEGEERNPETNRCRKVSSIAAATIDEIPQIKDIAVNQTKDTFNWSMSVLLVGGTGAYLAYEWRNEIRRKFRLLRKS